MEIGKGNTRVVQESNYNTPFQLLIYMVMPSLSMGLSATNGSCRGGIEHHTLLGVTGQC